MISRLLSVALLGLTLTTLPANAVTVVFDASAPDDQNVLNFSEGGIDFTVQANLDRPLNQRASSGLGISGGGQEGGRIAGTDILTVTFSQAVFITDITFSEFAEGIETATILLNGVTPNTFVLEEQGPDGFGGGANSRQTFLLPDALSQIAVTTLQLTGTAVNPDGNSGIRLRGFTIEAVPLPASMLLFFAAIGAFGLIGRQRSAAA